ncbi:MAG: helix-turn-helix domain-containing protein [Blautia sp.]
MNIKVVDYLMEFRLESAKLLMKNTDENLTEIWSKTGFTSAQYFSYVFKRKRRNASERIFEKDKE